MSNAKHGLVVLLSGVVLASAASSSTAHAVPTAAPATPPPPVQKVVVKPGITGFGRVLPGDGSLALKDGPLNYRVRIRNGSDTQMTKQVSVTRMPRTPGASSVGNFMVDLPKGETSSLLFSDAKSIADGCNPTRYAITLQDGAPRVGQVKPTCTFTFTKFPSTSGPQGTLANNPGCNQPWGLSAQVQPPMPPVNPSAQPPIRVLALREMNNAANVLGSVSVGASEIGATVTATIANPFMGLQGSFGLTYHTRSMTDSVVPP